MRDEHDEGIKEMCSFLGGQDVPSSGTVVCLTAPLREDTFVGPNCFSL